MGLLPIVALAIMGSGGSTVELISQDAQLVMVDAAEVQVGQGVGNSQTVAMLKRVAAQVSADQYSAKIDANSTASAGRALFWLGEIYRSGFAGVRQDPDVAIEYYRQSVQLGNPSAQYALATVFDDGLFGVPQNTGLSVLYDYFSALGGETTGLMSMGFRHEQGKGTPASCEASAAYYERAAHAVVKTWTTAPTVEKHPFYLFRGPDPYHQYLTIDESVMHAYVMVSDEAMRSGEGKDARVNSIGREGYLSKAAAHGPAKLAAALGKLYYWGTGYLQPDFPKSVQLLERAVELGNEAEVVVELGQLYLEGKGGVKKDYVKAHYYFSRGDRMGLAAAKTGLGLMWLHGLGPVDKPGGANKTKDVKKAKVLFTAANSAGEVMRLIEGLLVPCTTFHHVSPLFTALHRHPQRSMRCSHAHHSSPTTNHHRSPATTHCPYLPLQTSQMQRTSLVC
jgi:TPR repeat protein